VGYVGSQRDITHQKELDRLKDQFVSDVSHELRTPVTNIGLYLELLENVGSGKRDEYIQILHGEVNQLRRLIEDVLDISRLDVSKDRELTFMEMDLNLMVEQTVVAHRPLAESSGLDLTFNPDPSLPSIRGEPNQLARVVSNLLSNAIRYTSSGWIKVCTFQADSDYTDVNGEAVCIQVEDSGMGISNDDLQHIFERFYRGRDVAQAKFPGTGLGLAIAKEIVDMHSGWIDVESHVEKGSSFRIWLPV
ncbi:MAG: HAMP domain-containing sensor histidine kinase, partial [Anaerolineales bacterium]